MTPALGSAPRITAAIARHPPDALWVAVLTSDPVASLANVQLGYAPPVPVGGRRSNTSEYPVGVAIVLLVLVVLHLTVRRMTSPTCTVGSVQEIAVPVPEVTLCPTNDNATISPSHELPGHERPTSVQLYPVQSDHGPRRGSRGLGRAFGQGFLLGEHAETAVVAFPGTGGAIDEPPDLGHDYAATGVSENVRDVRFSVSPVFRVLLAASAAE